MMLFSQDDKPELTYPCRWEYKIIGASQRDIEQAVREVVVPLEYALDISNTSRGGKYCSALLKVVVPDEEIRRGLFTRLKAHRFVIMVL
jgi:putative lipoic acid-binding regulatory protein